MKTGMILYVTHGEEEIPAEAADNLVEMSRSLGVSAVAVATTEDEVTHGWFHLMTRGMACVLLQRVDYDPALCRFQPAGTALRLCG